MGLFAPFCYQANTVGTLGGKSMGEGWYHCRRCRKKFTVRVGTMFQRSPIPLHKWILAFRLAKKSGGITPYELHKELGITYKSARLMQERMDRYKTADAGSVWWERQFLTAGRT